MRIVLLPKLKMYLRRGIPTNIDLVSPQVRQAPSVVIMYRADVGMESQEEITRALATSNIQSSAKNC